MRSKFNYTAIAIILIYLTNASTTVFAKDWAPLVRRTMPSVVSLSGYNEQGQLISQSTGFSIGGDLVVTCWHCITPANQKMLITLKEGATYNVTHVVIAKPEWDLAIVRHDGADVPGLSLAESELPQGSAALVIGNPLGFEFSVADGIVSSWRSNNDASGRREIQFTNPISPGNSGGPVLNEDGEVLGVVSYRVSDSGASAQALNFGISYSHVSQLVDMVDEDREVIFSKRYSVYPKNKPDKDIVLESYYERLAENYIYNREYYRRVAIHTLEDIVRG